MQPHVAFEHARSTRCPASPCVMPTRGAYARAVRAFVARFPQVRTYTTWNEANHKSQPVATRPDMAAGYYEELVAACSGCTIVAGDVLDSGAYVRWLQRFRAATDLRPRLWGLHNYADVTYGRTTGTDAALAAVPGELWIEETGGIVTLLGTGGRVAMPTSEARAAASIRRAFALAAARPRIGRMYVYHWRSAAGAAFDSGLVRPDGSARPSLTALAELLRPAIAERWRARWSKGRLVLRVTCSGCRGRVAVTLRTKRGGRWRAKRVATRAYGAKKVLRIRVSRALRLRAKRATARRLRLVVKPSGRVARRVTLRLMRP